MKEKRLGMGLDALLGTAPAAEAGPAQELPIELLRPNPRQPRGGFDDEETRALADSIGRDGVLQPILVRRHNGYYEIVAGERRCRAARLAGRDTIPAVVRPVTDEQMLQFALIENLQRKDLNAMEKARAFEQLIRLNGWTQEQAADALGLARPTVANFLRLLEAPPEVQESIGKGAISMGHARALAGLANRAQAIRLLQRTINEDLSVRALEHAIAGESRTARKASARRKDPHVEDLERQLAERFGTRVEIRARGMGGEICIQYYSPEQLTGILQLIGM